MARKITKKPVPAAKKAPARRAQPMTVAVETKKAETRKAPEPKKAAELTYRLTEKGKALTSRPGSHRATAWAVLVAHAGKPEADAVAAINKAKAGSITGRNLIGWARKEGLIA